MLQAADLLVPGDVAPPTYAPSAQIAALLADARRSLDQDIGLARHYLDRLSSLLTTGRDKPCHEILLVPARLLDHAPADRGGLAGWQKARVLEHVERHLDTSLLADDLAAIVRLSTGHFSRAFKISMGETPHGYIIRCRIRRAQILMLETGDTLSQISYTCGLTDQAHLTRLFRRMVGTTPMIWRRSWQQPDFAIARGLRV